jgi:signal peptidase I
MSKKKPEETPAPVFAGPMASSQQRAVRETVESIVIAFILAFLFRTFEAEAFVIPTGSMAPTLHGMHKDVECPQCGIRYRVGASEESEEEAQRNGGQADDVERGMCPQCGYIRTDLRKEPSYGGDRILVNKFAYQLNEPERWDVIVFRFPGDAKMNYIKRLVGLPNETIRILYGDVFTAPNPNPNPAENPNFTIARKSPRKLQAMLQHVDDNHHIAKELDDAGYPRRWQVNLESPQGAIEETAEEVAFRADGHDGIRLAQRWQSNGANDNETAEIVFSNFTPGRFDRQRRPGTKPDWDRALRGPRWAPDEDVTLEPVQDFYSYNTNNLRHLAKRNYWVGDLAVECEVQVDELSGELVLQLEEGGYGFRVVFDLAAGAAHLEIESHNAPGNLIAFGDDRAGSKRPKAEGVITSTGKHKLALANCDDKLYVWIDDEPVEFDAPTEYAPLDNHEETDRDRIPARIAMTGFKGAIEHIWMKRDVYYTPLRPDQDENIGREDRPLVFHAGPDQFFTLGDNSPASMDGRIWTGEVPGTPHVVDRRLLIGKALFIYWPYGQLLPRTPLFERFKLIR